LKRPACSPVASLSARLQFESWRRRRRRGDFRHNRRGLLRGNPPDSSDGAGRSGFLRPSRFGRFLGRDLDPTIEYVLQTYSVR